MIEKIEDTILWNHLKENSITDNEVILRILVATKIMLSLSPGILGYPTADYDPRITDIQNKGTWDEDEYNEALNDIRKAWEAEANEKYKEIKNGGVIGHLHLKKIYNQLMTYYTSLSIDYGETYVDEIFTKWINELPKTYSKTWANIRLYTLYVSLNLYLLKRKNVT